MEAKLDCWLEFGWRTWRSVKSRKSGKWAVNAKLLVGVFPTIIRLKMYFTTVRKQTPTPAMTTQQKPRQYKWDARHPGAFTDHNNSTQITPDFIFFFIVVTLCGRYRRCVSNVDTGCVPSPVRYSPAIRSRTVATTPCARSGKKTFQWMWGTTFFWNDRLSFSLKTWEWVSLAFPDLPPAPSGKRLRHHAVVWLQSHKAHVSPGQIRNCEIWGFFSLKFQIWNCWQSRSCEGSCSCP